MKCFALALLLASFISPLSAQIDQTRDPALLTIWYTPHKAKWVGKTLKASLFKTNYRWQIYAGAAELFDHSQKWLTLTIAAESDSSEINDAIVDALVITADNHSYEIPAGVMASSLRAPQESVFHDLYFTWIVSGQSSPSAVAIGNQRLEEIIRAVSAAKDVYVTFVGAKRIGTKLEPGQISLFQELIERYDRINVASVSEGSAHDSSKPRSE